MGLKPSSTFAIWSSNNNILNLFAVPAHHHHHHHHPSSITSPSSRRRPTLDHQTPCKRRPPTTTTSTASRCYATVNNTNNTNINNNGNNGNPKNEPGQESITCPPWPACTSPTPYDIFAMPKSAPYAKSRFAELVKLYHPDKHHAAALDSLPARTRLERYHLVVLANDILSSPDKRRAYDSWGAGWHLPGAAGNDDARDVNDIYRQADKSWRHGPGNPSMNATWEDWERWYERRDGGGRGEKQQPVFMSNASFAALVLAALAVGTVAQTTRMDNNSAYFIERRQAHEAIISEALRRQGAATAGKGREERIERFLREREETNSYDLTPAHLPGRHESNAK